MASLLSSRLSYFSSAPSYVSSKFRTTSSSHCCTRNAYNSQKMLVSGRRNAVPAWSSLLQEVESWTSIQPQLKSYWFLLSPWMLVPLLANSKSRQLFSPILESTGRIIINLRRLLVLHFHHWQGVQRGLVQLSTVLILAHASYFNIAAGDPYDTFENVPPDISGGEIRKRIQRPKSKKAELCTQKCVGTCIRGGAGSPGEGPFNIRNLVECSDICNLIGDRDDGP